MSKNVMPSFSYCLSDGLADLFRSMFPDSTIAEKFCFIERKANLHISLIMALHHIFLLYW